MKYNYLKTFKKVIKLHWLSHKRKLHDLLIKKKIIKKSKKRIKKKKISMQKP